MDRRAKMLVGLDVARMTGAEIGPLTTPIVSKAEGQIFYVDHTDTASLRTKYKDDPNVRISDIVDVDVVWGEQTLADAFGPDRKLDYILASHVIEHVPDLITWLEELRAVLHPTGRINLAVPDKRFTFDFLREETRLADLLNAYLVRARRPLPHEILDFTLNCASVDLKAAWDGSLDPASLVPSYTFDQVLDIARDEMDNHQYHDVHCWVFTPQSFAHLLGKLAEFGLVRFACDWFSETEPYSVEFFVSLRASDDRAAIVSSWEKMSEAASKLGKGSLEDDLHQQTICALNRERTLSEQLQSARESLRQLEVEREALESKVVALERSTSWRVTAPLRTVRQVLNRAGGQR